MKDSQTLWIFVCFNFDHYFVEFDKFIQSNVQISGADPGFGQGGAPASEAESCRHSKAESRKHSAAGVQGPLKGPGSFWVFDAQICILAHSRDTFSLIFDIYFDTKS